MNKTLAIYRSRFAPTPSGPLHLGSLFAAVVSFLDARKHSGDWLLRIDDIDPPREQKGAADLIITTLETHGLHWDEPISYQSQNSQRYEQLLSQLRKKDRLFGCICSRKDLKAHNVYPGTCRDQHVSHPQPAIRLKVTSTRDHFDDIFQNRISADPKHDYGDVILKRKDNLYAYQLACAADDIADKMTHIIRGIDLMESVFWQREIYHTMSCEPPIYGHFAVIHAAQSQQKLSKQNMAPAVDNKTPEQNLQTVFQLLNLPVDKDTIHRMLEQAIYLWSRKPLMSKQMLFNTLTSTSKCP